MHVEDEADDQLIADELKSQVITRSQSQAVERAKQNALVPSVTPQTAASKHPSKKGTKAVLVSKPSSAVCQNSGVETGNYVDLYRESGDD